MRRESRPLSLPNAMRRHALQAQHSIARTHSSNAHCASNKRDNSKHAPSLLLLFLSSSASFPVLLLLHSPYPSCPPPPTPPTPSSASALLRFSLLPPPLSPDLDEADDHLGRLLHVREVARHVAPDLGVDHLDDDDGARRRTTTTHDNDARRAATTAHGDDGARRQRGDDDARRSPSRFHCDGVKGAQSVRARVV